MPTKQVIVVQRGLKMRRGKEIAQGGHGVQAFLTRRLRTTKTKVKNARGDPCRVAEIALTQAEIDWLHNSFKKVTLQVPNEEELLAVLYNARKAGLEAHLVTDSGKTEFGGVPTNTVVVIGPDYDEKIDPVTGHLKLY